MFGLFGKKNRLSIEPFQWKKGDPLEVEHQLVAQLVSEALRDKESVYGFELNLDATEAGKKILEADAEASVRLLLALIAHTSHFDAMGRKVRALANDEMERLNWHQTPEWKSIWPPRQVTAHAVIRIMRRKLPLQREHLLTLSNWIASDSSPGEYSHPLKSFIKAVEEYGRVDLSDTDLHSSLSRVVKALRVGHFKDLPKLAYRIETLLETPVDPAPENTRRMEPVPSVPTPAGSPQILRMLKQFLGIASGDNATPSTLIGLDQFPLPADSPLQKEHELINMILPEVIERPGYHDPDLCGTEAGRAILALDAAGKGRILLALAERCINARLSQARLEDHRLWQSRYAITGILHKLLTKDVAFARDSLFDFLLFLSALGVYEQRASNTMTEELLSQVEAFSASTSFSDGERHILHRLRCRMVRTPPFGQLGPDVIRMNKLLRDGIFLALVPGETWSDAVNSELADMKPVSRDIWLALLSHAATATGSRPSAKWLKTAKQIVKKAGAKKVTEALLRWFPMVSSPRTIRLLGGEYGSRNDSDGAIHEDNATCLRGLLWLSPELSEADLIRTIGALTISCYRKVPGVGPRAVKAGNAGVYALSQLNDPLALGQLALLKIKVKFGSAQKEIKKAFTLAAERSGLPREELEEMSVPTYGLTEVGVCEEKLGDFTARLVITGTDSTELTWIKPDGSIQRGVPTAVKSSHADDLKELQAAAKDIQKMLPAQRERIDNLFLQQRTWPFNIWRERYLDHPLVGTLGRRILWEFTEGTRTTTGIWFNGNLVDIDLKPIELVPAQATVRLWHPIGKNVEEVAGWRDWLEAQQIQQPFKQAHREIYLLTEAELRTRNYSNRYAAHVLKQHQFNALCAARGWKNQLRLMVDASYSPPSLRLPQWNLRAEFWVEGIGTDYGNDTNDSGTFLRLSSDQVRFYRIDSAQRSAHAGGGGYHPGYHEQGAEPLALDEIPPLVFSEVMRDVDLFVGVSSIGNDPTWADGGPQGRYQAYWQNFSFGDLNATAKTRKDVLQRLVPKLKISGSCRFEEKFLIVKGSLRTYKIHLGSGNILMEPNDQYLCIVPNQGDAESSPVLLPFEGDRTLSVILSKAFMLARDEKIKDSSIISQIRQK
jgi:hypothetical protein